MFRLYATIIVIGIVVSAMGGAYLYYKDTQKTIGELNQQVATFSQAVDQQKEAISSLQESISAQAKIRDEMYVEIKSARSDVEKLQNKIATHDFKQIASRKSVLLEKKINQSTIDIMRCFEIATGDKVHPDEKNNQCSDLLNTP